jgi:hypothetical protein
MNTADIISPRAGSCASQNTAPTTNISFPLNLAHVPPGKGLLADGQNTIRAPNDCMEVYIYI